jgi:hypothetical protein
MSVSIITCPGCKQLILSDTVQCPTCHHVFDEEKASKITTELPTVVKAAEDEISCPDCGEMVRAGLVRCWRCGGFLREEIAETYQKMLDGPQKVTYSEVAAEQLNQKKTDVSKKEATPEPEKKKKKPVQTSVADEDDFQLADGINMISPEQLAMKQKAEARAEAQLQKKSAEKDETYGLASSPETEAPEEVADPAAQESAPEKPEEEAKPVEGAVPAEAKTDNADADSGEASADGKEAADGEPGGKLAASGDALLDIAMQEENEVSSRRKTRAKEKSRTKGDRVALKGFLYVYCPNGHQIQVEEKYRGQTGRCPRCKSFFHVPQLDWQAKKNQQKEAEAEAQKESRYKVWLLDAKIHQVDPTKLKLKPGSLQKEFQETDLGFTDENLLIVTHGKQNAGLFVGEKNKKKIDELRTAVQEHLRLDQELLDLPAAGYREYKKEAMENIQVVQPTAAIHESIFAGVPVFGEGLIAVRMPVTEQDKDVKDVLFVSFSLSEFREFGEQLKELFGIEDLGLLQGVSLEDSTSKHKCHYSDRIIESIEATEYHHADTKMELEIVGRKCQSCNLVVSEEARKKEKLGGAAGKGIAKAKCPKCTQKFGDKTLYGFKKPEGEAEGLDAGGGMKT